MRFRSAAGSRRWAPPLATALLFAALCATATYWGLQLFAPPVVIAPSGSLVDWDKAPDLATASRLFGAPPGAEEAAQAAVEASNIRVVGVAASLDRGTAVLSVDDKPPRAYLAGDRIDEHARLLEVRPDAVVIEQAGARLELPTPERPDIAILSSGPSAGLGASTAGFGATGSPARPGAAASAGAGRAPIVPRASGTPGMPAYGSAAAPVPQVPPYGSDAAPSTPPYGSDAAAQAAEDGDAGAASPGGGAANAPGMPSSDGYGSPDANPEVSAAASENSSPPPMTGLRGGGAGAGAPQGTGGMSGTAPPGVPGAAAPAPAPAQPSMPGIRSGIGMAGGQTA